MVAGNETSSRGSYGTLVPSGRCNEAGKSEGVGSRRPKSGGVMTMVPPGLRFAMVAFGVAAGLAGSASAEEEEHGYPIKGLQEPLASQVEGALEVERIVYMIAVLPSGTSVLVEMEGKEWEQLEHGFAPGSDVTGQLEYIVNSLDLRMDIGDGQVLYGSCRDHKNGRQCCKQAISSN
jgi:hypothetical protein